MEISLFLRYLMVIFQLPKYLSSTESLSMESQFAQMCHLFLGSVRSLLQIGRPWWEQCRTFRRLTLNESLKLHSTSIPYSLWVETSICKVCTMSCKLCYSNIFLLIHTIFLLGSFYGHSVSGKAGIHRKVICAQASQPVSG